MWPVLRDVLDSAKEALGIEASADPDPAAVTDMVTSASDQASQAATTATDAAAAVAATATDVGGRAAGPVGEAGEAVTAVSEQLTSKLTDLLGRFGG